MSIIDTFLQQILHSLQAQDGKRVADFLVLNFDNLPPAQQKPYQDLHKELNIRYPVGKDASLSTKVKTALPSEQLRAAHTYFCEAIIQYFRYVRGFTAMSGLQKARAIEKLTKQCIGALVTDQPGPTMIPIVLYLTNTLRQIAMNLDRDPGLLGSQSKSNDDDSSTSISYVEQCGNTLRDAFNRLIAKCNPKIPPSPNRLDSGLYQIVNSCMRIYLRAGKLANSAPILDFTKQKSPPLHYYPVAQRVTYLYYLGVFYFNSNQFYRAVQCLQTSYDECAKNEACMSQRRLILTHLFAASLCIGRLPTMQICFVDSAALAVATPFVMLASIIKRGDIGVFHTFTDHTLPAPLSTTANLLLRKKVLLQIRSRCEILCWRSLVYRAMKYGGTTGTGDQGRTMPFVRLAAIHQAAGFSYERARKALSDGTGGSINLYGSLNGEEDGGVYIDRDFDDTGSDGDDGGSDDAYFAGSDSSLHPEPDEGGSAADHPPLVDPTPEEVNSVVLSLIHQGFLRGFVHHTLPDLLQSRFAIPGMKAALNREGSGQGDELWKELGFPSVFEVVREKEDSISGGFVPAWVTEETAGAGGMGGQTVHIKGARPAGT